MKHPEIYRYKQQIDGLFKRVKPYSGDPELQSHWARYLCILVSGLIEVSVRSIYSDYATRSASPSVARYVANTLRDFQNPSMQKILDIAGAFSEEWQEELERSTAGELADAISSVVANRHNLAHGRPVGISYTRMKDYYQRIIKVIELIDHQCAR